MSEFFRKKETIKASFAFCFLVFVVWFGLGKSKPISASHQRHGSFCCAVNCMDGRVQDVVKDYMRKYCDVDYVDMITEAGPNKVLADNPKSGLAKEIIIDIKERILTDNADKSIIENIKKRVEISARHHGSKVVAVVGHFGCAGNPASKNEQIQHLKKAKETVESFGFDIRIILLWVEKDFKTIELVN